jgi:hypothetical protein
MTVWTILALALACEPNEAPPPCEAHPRPDAGVEPTPDAGSWVRPDGGTEIPSGRRGPVAIVERATVDSAGAFNALGATMMWAPWGYKFDRARLEENLRFLADHGFDYIRVLGEVGSDEPDDYWSDRPIDPRWPDYDEVIAGLTDLAWHTYGLRVEWTVFGGTDFSPTEADRVALVDRVLAMTVGREDAIMMIEISNEGYHTGFEGDAGIAELRALTEHVAERTAIPVASTSWHEDLEGFCRLYSESAADLATMHFDRAISYEDEAWRPVRQPWGYPIEFPCEGLPPAVSNNEPIGPYSSVATEFDPLHLVMAQAVTFVAGNAMYVFHTGPGITGGGHAGVERGIPANFWEVPDIETTLAGFEVMREVIPPGVASWERQNSAWAGYPLEANPDEWVRAYAAVSDTELVVLPFGMRNPVTMTARSAMELRAIDPLSGEVIETFELDEGESFVLPERDALVLRGTFR